MRSRFFSSAGPSASSRSFRRLGVVEQAIGRLALGRQRGQEQPALPRDRNDEAIVAVDETKRLILGDRVDGLERSLPRLAPAEALEIINGFLHFRGRRRHLQRAGRIVVGDLVFILRLGLTVGERRQEQQRHQGQTHHDRVTFCME